MQSRILMDNYFKRQILELIKVLKFDLQNYIIVEIIIII